MNKCMSPLKKRLKKSKKRVEKPKKVVKKSKKRVESGGAARNSVPLKPKKVIKKSKKVVKKSKKVVKKSKKRVEKSKKRVEKPKKVSGTEFRADLRSAKNRMMSPTKHIRKDRRTSFYILEDDFSDPRIMEGKTGIYTNDRNLLRKVAAISLLDKENIRPKSTPSKSFREILNSYTVNDLKKDCRLLGLKCSGTKKDIVDRIFKFTALPNQQLKNLSRRTI